MTGQARRGGIGVRFLGFKLFEIRSTDADTRLFHVVYYHVSAVFVAPRMN